MTVSSKEAAEIAQRHGLNLSDAAAIAQLAGDVDEAKELAEKFAKPEAKPERDVAEIVNKIPRP